MPTRLLRKLLQSDRERFLESLLESATDYAIITLDLDGLHHRLEQWSRAGAGLDRGRRAGAKRQLVLHA